MEFGAQEFFNRLKDGMSKGDQVVYEELNSVVNRSVRNLVRSRVRFSDVDEVIQEIQCSVWVHMSFFLESSENNAPAQRNAWLIKIANSRINDFLNKNYKNECLPLEDVGSLGGGPAPGPTPPTPVDEEEQANFERCCRIVSYICSLDMAPDRILACLYNALLIPAMARGNARKKGDPEAIVRRFSGRPLSEFRDFLWKELRFLFRLPMPEDVLAPLDRKLVAGAGNKPFRLTTREITLVSSRARKSLQKKCDEIMGGTLDE